MTEKQTENKKINTPNSNDKGQSENKKGKYNRKPRGAPRQVKVGEYEEKVIQIRRVSKKTKGGNQISFSALVVVGNRDGSVGCGYGKAKSVVEAIGKAISKAKEELVNVNLNGTTIPHDIIEKYGAAMVLLKPAPAGTGINAGGSIRVVVELAGIKDVSSKMLGTNNKISNVRCTVNALSRLKSRK